MFRSLVIAVVLTVVPGIVSGDDKPEVPKAAKNTVEILKVVESVKGFGIVSTCEYRSRDARTFIVWFNPYSGRAACHVHGYHYDAKKEQWIEFLGRQFEGTHDVSVEVGSVLTIRDVKGSVVYKEKPQN